MNGSGGPHGRTRTRRRSSTRALPPLARAAPGLAVPNVSEGRDADTIAALADACRVPGARVIDVHSDPDHHRSVLTVVGRAAGAAGRAGRASPASASTASTCAATAAPTRGSARSTSRRSWRSTTRTSPWRARSPPGSRRGWATSSTCRSSSTAPSPPTRPAPCRATSAARGSRSSGGRSTRASWCPTTGPPRLHPTAGAALVGVRPPLIALNVWLPEGTPHRRARHRRPRARGRRRPARRARPRPLPARGRHGAGVHEPRGPPRRRRRRAAIAAVRAAADALGVESGEAELVGLVPREALRGPSPSALGIRGMRPGQILELRVPGLAPGPRLGRAVAKRKRRKSAGPPPVHNPKRAAAGGLGRGAGEGRAPKRSRASRRRRRSGACCCARASSRPSSTRT